MENGKKKDEKKEEIERVTSEKGKVVEAALKILHLLSLAPVNMWVSTSRVSHHVRCES